MSGSLYTTPQMLPPTWTTRYPSQQHQHLHQNPIIFLAAKLGHCLVLSVIIHTSLHPFYIPKVPLLWLQSTLIQIFQRFMTLCSQAPRHLGKEKLVTIWMSWNHRLKSVHEWKKTRIWARGEGWRVAWQVPVKPRSKQNQVQKQNQRAEPPGLITLVQRKSTGCYVA